MPLSSLNFDNVGGNFTNHHCTYTHELFLELSIWLRVYLTSRQTGDFCSFFIFDILLQKIRSLSLRNDSFEIKTVKVSTISYYTVYLLQFKTQTRSFSKLRQSGFQPFHCRILPWQKNKKTHKKLGKVLNSVFLNRCAAMHKCGMFITMYLDLFLHT